MEYDPYVTPMAKEDWREFARRAESLTDTFESTWGWDRTAEICRIEIFETSECLVLSVAFRFAGHDMAITITGSNYEGLVQTMDQMIMGSGWHMCDFVGQAQKLGLDSEGKKK